jgi:hypothetical protein
MALPRLELVWEVALLLEVLPAAFGPRLLFLPPSALRRVLISTLPPHRLVARLRLRWLEAFCLFGLPLLPL